MPRRGDDRRRLARLKQVAREASVPLLAVNDVLYASPEQRDLQDILTCIREGTTIPEAGDCWSPTPKDISRHQRKWRAFSRIVRRR